METNNQGRTKGRIRWLWIMAIVGVIGLAAVTRWFTKRLPPPVVSLSLVGFKSTPTNSYALMCLSNHVPTMICFNYDWVAEFDTGSRVVTNESPFSMGGTPLGTWQQSSENFQISIPPGVEKWRLTATYRYFLRHHPWGELTSWHVKSNVTNKVANLVLFSLEDVARRMPKPNYDVIQITSPWLTNRPPLATNSK